MSIAIPHKANGHLQLAVSSTETSLKVDLQSFEAFIRLSGDEVYAVLRGTIAREIVKIDISNSSDGVLSVARGQGGSTAMAWPAGTLLFHSTHADHYNDIIQRAANRIIDYNPNQILAPLYAGEKVYQSSPSRWWKSFNGVDSYWSLISGSPEMDEVYTDIGWDYDILIPTKGWQVHFDNNDWDPKPNEAYWNAGGWWDSDDAGYNKIVLLPKGTWNAGYRPEKFRISILPTSFASKLIEVTFGSTSQLVQLDGTMSDGQEFNINSSWYNDGDINGILFWRVFQGGSWDLTNLEWYA